jgi:hypothetical protein
MPVDPQLDITFEKVNSVTQLYCSSSGDFAYPQLEK